MQLSFGIFVEPKNTGRFALCLRLRECSSLYSVVVATDLLGVVLHIYHLSIHLHLTTSTPT